MGRACRPADPLCRRHGLHPYRVPADHRASLRSVLGLPDDRPLRADGPLRRPGGFCPLRRRRPPRRHRRHPRLGAGAFPDRRSTAWPGSTARRSTSMPTRARASIPTGTPRSTISAAARWSPSSSTTRSSGPRNTISTACASMPSPRCSTSTIRARQGEWIPNEKGGRENLEAVSFLQKMNEAVYGAHPGVMTIAEESTSWPKVSQPVHEGGLGFGFKWNMGFMHDTLEYFSQGADPPQAPSRRHHLRPGLRLQREFRAAALAMTRWCTARARCSARWPATTGRNSRICAPTTPSCGAIPARSCCSWGRNSPSAANGARRGRSTGTCSITRRIAACGSWCATSTTSTARARRCMRAIARRKALPG